MLPREDIATILQWNRLERFRIPEQTYNETYNALKDRIVKLIRAFLPTSFASRLIVIVEWFRFENPMPKDENIISVDIDSNENLKEMTEIIIRHSKPNYREDFAKKTKSNDLSAVKNYVHQTADQIATNYGITRSTVTFYFTRSIIAILEELEKTLSEDVTTLERNNNSLEVNKDGGIVIADYTYTFCGKVTHSCWTKSHDVRLNIAVKVWRFMNAAHLKNEWNRFSRL